VGHRALRSAILAAAIAGGALVAGPASPVGAVGPCSPTATQTLTGAQPEFTSRIAANARVDAANANWIGTTSYPVHFYTTGDSCWDGGVITGTFPVTATWNFFHGNAAFGFSDPNFTVNRPRIFNYGDGIQVRDGADGFAINDAYLAYIHDDCIENDRLVSGTLNNSYLDGCYVGLSARRIDGTTVDGHLNTWTISNSLLRLQAMPTVYSGSAAGHGGWFKWDDTAPTSPKLSISNSIFRADQNTNHQSLNLPTGYPVTCSGNTVVWLGTGAFPGAASWLAACPDTVITTNRSVWDTAARAWDIAHPGVITGPEVSVGDASVLEGSSGTRALRFPLTLSSPPGPGKTVTVYWATAPGTAASSDFTVTKGKAVFTETQVAKMLTVNVKQDTNTEPNELMSLVVAGVLGGENHRERGTGTIVNDDPGTGVRLGVSDSTIVEGDAGVRSLIVPITLTSPATADVLIKWSTLGTGSALAGSDYTSRAGTVKIAATKRLAYLTIPMLPDTNSEGTETFQVVVNSATNASIIDGTGVVTIRDDD
jgi:Calx-beta domain.